MIRKLREYQNFLESILTACEISGNPAITGITNHAGKVIPGTIFTAITGSVHDGRKFIPQAVENGAAAIVYSGNLEKRIPGVSYLQVSDAYHAYALLAEAWFDFPAKELKLVGITGTNGKTTTAWLLKYIFDVAGKNSGLISTIVYKYGNREIKAERTTPEAFELQKLLREMADAGCEYVVMEVSSHGLDQHRIGSAKFAAGVYTNLSGDHLDYHHDLDNYFSAKKLLFTEYLAPDGVAVINADDISGRKLAGEVSKKQLITYGRWKSADCQVVKTVSLRDKNQIEFEFNGKKFKIDSVLVGDFNVSNVSAAVSAALGLQIGFDKIISAMQNRIQVPGRLEKYVSNDGVEVFVDYAHTDDALKKALQTLKNLKPHKLRVVFGCGGDRDKSKRSRMGKVASQLADSIVLTNDNPRSEEPMEIIQDIMAGIVEDSDVEIITDRAEAIGRAVASASPGDIVLVAGKGHEEQQNIRGVLSFFKDSIQVQASINARSLL